MRYYCNDTVSDSLMELEENDNYDVEAACIPLRPHEQTILYPACLVSGTMLRGGTCGQWLTAVIDFTSLNFSYTPPKKEEYIMRAEILSNLTQVDGIYNETEAEEIELTPCSWFVGNEKRERVSVQCRFFRAGKYSLFFFCRPKNKKFGISPKNYTTCIGQGEYVISLAPGPAYGGMCVLNRGEYEEEKYIIYCETNIEQSVLLFTKDKYGNHCITGDANVTCVGIGNVTVTSVMNRQNGEYELRFIKRSKDAGLKIIINDHLLEKGCIYLCNTSTKTRKIVPQWISSPDMNCTQLEHFLHTLSSKISSHFSFDPSSLSDSTIQDHILKNGSLSAQLNKLASCQETLRFMYKAIKRLLNVKDPRSFENIGDKDLDDKTLMSLSNELKKLKEEIICEEKHVEAMFYKMIHDDSVETPPFFNSIKSSKNLQNYEEKKDFLKQFEVTLEDRLKDLKTRFNTYCRKRECLTKQICETIDSNISHLKQYERAYTLLQKKMLKAQLVTQKKQKRRDDLGGNALPAIVAQQANSMRHDMIQHVQTYQIQERLPIVVKKKEAINKAQRFSKKSSSTLPSDPKNPAYWIAKGSIQKHLKRSSPGKALPASNSKMFVVQNYCRGLEQNFFL